MTLFSFKKWAESKNVSLLSREFETEETLGIKTQQIFLHALSSQSLILEMPNNTEVSQSYVSWGLISCLMTQAQRLILELRE